MTLKLKNLINAFHIPSREERERAYLNASADRYDLEYRQRQVDAGLFREKPLFM